jgi:hypothetical protein
MEKSKVYVKIVRTTIPVAEFEMTPAIEWAESHERTKEYQFYTANSSFFLELLDDATEARYGLLHVIPEHHKDVFNSWELLYPWDKPDDQISA